MQPLLLLLLLALLGASATATATLTPWTLDPHNTIFLVEPVDSGFDARTPFALCWRDIQQDFYKVLGVRPSKYVGFKRPDHYNGTVIYLGAAASKRVLPQDNHPEAHAIVVFQTDSYVDIVLTGNSARAEVYAAYAFSEHVLNVAPLWWWTDTEPTYQGSLTFNSVDELSKQYAAPTFKWRGFFPNDEDLLGNFRPDPLGQSVFSSEIWNRICEALLRLKGNLIIAGTVSFPDESHYKVIKRRGLFVSMQHFTLLGVNTWRWPKGVPYSFEQKPDIQDHVWKASLDAYTERQAVWTIGYRGLNDYAFWIDEPKFNTTKKRCKLISDAMAHQASIVRSTAGRENDEMVTYLWSEMLDLYLSGDLVIPQNSCTVFADAGGSGKFDPRIYDKLKPGDGVYYHVQMESPGNMAQMTEMVPPKSFFEQLSRFVKAGATSYFMLNLSDLKPAAFMVDTIMRYLWDPSPVINMKDNHKAEEVAINRWSRLMFGATYQAEAASVMSGYFNIDYIRANATGTTRRYGDEHLTGTLRKLLSGQENASEALSFVNGPLIELETLYNQALKLHATMVDGNSPSAPFFQASFLLFVSTHWFGCSAIEALAKGNTNGAIQALASLRSVQRKAEGTKWRGFYGADRLLDLQNVDCLIRHQSTLKTNPNPLNCQGPNGHPWRGGTGPWSDWFTYANTTSNFPFLNPPSVEWSMARVVRVLCVSNGCDNTPVGGTFVDVATIEMSAPAATSATDLTIRYTLDGSEPTSSSMAYSGSFNITQTTKIAARVFQHTVDGPPMLVTRPTFTQKKMNDVHT